MVRWNKEVKFIYIKSGDIIISIKVSVPWVILICLDI
jgi:hypothetical protein